MVRHYNPSIVERAQRILNTKMDNLSDEVNGPLAVIPIEPICRISRSQQAIVTGSSTIYTTPTDKDFYLCNVQFSFSKDAACDVATGSIGIQTTIDGAAQIIIRLPVITLTAQNNTLSFNFVKPLKIDRGVTLILTGTYTAGVMSRTGNIVGYTEETTST